MYEYTKYGNKILTWLFHGTIIKLRNNTASVGVLGRLSVIRNHNLETFVLCEPKYNTLILLNT